MYIEKIKGKQRDRDLCADKIKNSGNNYREKDMILFIYKCAVSSSEMHRKLNAPNIFFSFIS